MKSFRAAGWLSLSIGCSAAAVVRRNASKLEWGPCDTVGNTTTTLLCSSLRVPRDYSNMDNTETILLQLAKSPATKEPVMPSILFNPGGPGYGPGYAGRNDSDLLHEKMQIILGGHHDIVTWDFRGTGKTMLLPCFNTESDRAAFQSQFLGQTTNGSDAAAGEAWATGEWLAALCANSTQAQNVGELVGTAYTARDMMQIVDALGEDGLLRFWGISYGTALGEAVAAMFPDRMEKVVLDAVLNPSELFAGGSVSQISDADAIFESFLKECLEAPELCLLATHGNSTHELAHKIYIMLEALKYKPAVFGLYGLMPYGLATYNILGMLYSRSSFSALDLLLDTLVTGNTTQYALYLASNAALTSEPKPFPDYSAQQSKENIWGIRCTDESHRADHLAEMLPLLDRFHRKSRLIDDVSWSTTALICSQWPYRAKERLRADQFHDIQTKSPMLVVQNRYDPVTSVEAARNASQAFPGSKLLINDGHGHGLLSEPTLCTVKALRAYFNEGVSPDDDETFCASKAPPFVVQELADVLADDDGEASE